MKRIKTLPFVILLAVALVIPMSVAAESEVPSVYPFGQVLIDEFAPAPPPHMLAEGQFFGVNHAPIYQVVSVDGQYRLQVWYAKRYTETALGLVTPSALPLPGFEGPWMGWMDPELRQTEILGPARSSVDPVVLEADPDRILTTMCVVHVLDGESYRIEVNDYNVVTEVNGFVLNGVRAYHTVGIFKPGRGDPAVPRCDPAYELIR